MFFSYLICLYRGANAFWIITGVQPLNYMHIANEIDLIGMTSPPFRSEYPFSVRSTNFSFASCVRGLFYTLNWKYLNINIW